MAVWGGILIILFILGLLSPPKEEKHDNWMHFISMWLLMICITALFIADKLGG